MKSLYVSTIAAIVLVLSVGLAPVAAAAPLGPSAHGEPVGGCPPPFTPHPAADHEHPETHRHIGNDTDQNGDGWICVKPSGKDNKNHVHIDNVLPL